MTRNVEHCSHTGNLNFKFPLLVASGCTQAPNKDQHLLNSENHAAQARPGSSSSNSVSMESMRAMAAVARKEARGVHPGCAFRLLARRNP